MSAEQGREPSANAASGSTSDPGGNLENRLVLALTTALRVSRLHALDNAVVVEALEQLLEVLTRFLARRDKAALLRVERRLYLNGRLVRAGHHAAWLDGCVDFLAERGIGGVLFSGLWSLDALRVALGAFAARPQAGEARVRAIAAAARALAPPARLDVLDEDQALAFAQEAEEGDLASHERAVFYFARLVALAEATHDALRQGRSPDAYGHHLRQTFMKVIEFQEDPGFARRLLGTTLIAPAAAPQAIHAAQVAVLCLGMGRLLGLGRGELADLGFAAFFHDLGRLWSPHKTEQGGRREFALSAAGHVTEGVRACLRGRSTSSAGLLRLVATQEHHLESDGFPFLEQEPHPYSQLIGTADAFTRFEQGRPWRDPLAPGEALEQLEEADACDPACRELLRDVLGRVPRGSFLRLTCGSVVAVVDGGAARGHRPLTRRMLTPEAAPDPAGLLQELSDPGAIAAEVDPSWLGVEGWRIVFGQEGGADSGPAPRAWTPPRAQPRREAPAGEQVRSEDAEAVHRILEAVQRAVRFFRLYPHEHPLCAESVGELEGSLAPFLEWHGTLELQVQRDGLSLGGRQVLADTGHTSDLSAILYPEGVRALRIERGIPARELHGLIETLAGQEDHQEGLGADDLLSALWQREFTHVHLVVYDQLSPAGLDQLQDPTLEGVGRRIRELMGRWALDDPGRAAELARFVAGLPALDPEDPASWGGRPEQRARFLETAAGAARRRFLSRLGEPEAQDLLGRAAAVVRWAVDGPEPPADADVAAFLTGSILGALWQGRLSLAGELLDHARAGGEPVHRAVSRRLAERHGLKLLLAGALGDETGPGLCERYLRGLHDDAADGLSRVYGHLGEEDEQRRLLRTFLAPRRERVAGVLARLACNADRRIAREALVLLAGGEEGGRARAALEGCVADAEQPERARLAGEVLDELTGAGERRRCLETLQQGEDKAQRLAAARRLGELGDRQAFDALVELVKQRELRTRDADEVNAVFEALTRLGGVRAVRVLEEIAGWQGLLTSKGKRRVAQAAGSWLRTLRSAPGDTHTTRAFRRMRQCPRCRFPNAAVATRCLSCGESFPPAGADRALAPDSPEPAPEPAAAERVQIPRPTGEATRVVRRRRPAAPPPAPPAPRDPPGEPLADEPPGLSPVAPAAQAEEEAPLPFLAAGAGEEPPEEEAEPLPAPYGRVRYGEREVAERALAWLRCPPFPSVPLGLEPTLTIGRRRACDLVLPHPSVSREHVRIRVLGGQMLLEDQSNFGTWVNGEKVLSAELAIGDVITCGPYDLRVEAPERAVAAEDHDTRPLRTFSSSEAMGGGIGGASLAELLQQVEHTQKTGTLLVFVGETRGSLVVYEGRPVYAELGELRDDEAVLAMIRMRSGEFSFSHKIEPGEMTMSTTLEALLFRAATEEA